MDGDDEDDLSWLRRGRGSVYTTAPPNGWWGGVGGSGPDVSGRTRRFGLATSESFRFKF
jgi:hypothetical protein